MVAWFDYVACVATLLNMFCSAPELVHSALPRHVLNDSEIICQRFLAQFTTRLSPFCSESEPIVQRFRAPFVLLEATEKHKPRRQTQ